MFTATAAAETKWTPVTTLRALHERTSGDAHPREVRGSRRYPDARIRPSRSVGRVMAGLRGGSGSDAAGVAYPRLTVSIGSVRTSPPSGPRLRISCRVLGGSAARGRSVTRRCIPTGRMSSSAIFFRVMPTAEPGVSRPAVECGTGLDSRRLAQDQHGGPGRVQHRCAGVPGPPRAREPLAGGITLQGPRRARPATAPAPRTAEATG